MSIFFNVPKFKTLLVQQAYAVNVLNQCRSILWGWGWPIKFNIPQNNWWIVTRWPFYCIPQILCGYTQNCWSYSYASGPTFFFNLFFSNFLKKKKFNFPPYRIGIVFASGTPVSAQYISVSELTPLGQY